VAKPWSQLTTLPFPSFRRPLVPQTVVARQALQVSAQQSAREKHAGPWLQIPVQEY
jgi:hypothetical protein